jgi:hypothetical protein
MARRWDKTSSSRDWMAAKAGSNPAYLFPVSSLRYLMMEKRLTLIAVAWKRIKVMPIPGLMAVSHQVTKGWETSVSKPPVDQCGVRNFLRSVKIPGFRRLCQETESYFILI